MKSKITLLFLIATNFIFSQVKALDFRDIWIAKEFSKEQALYDSKNFLFKRIFKTTTEPTTFEVIPLAAASSGELTTLLYRCTSVNQEGLVLGFYGDYWNDAGVVYQGFAFKNFDKKQAIEFLEKIQAAIDANSKYLKEDSDSNNVVFTYDDVDILVFYSSNSGILIRLFWKGFDSSWNKTAFDRSKRRFEKKI